MAQPWEFSHIQARAKLDSQNCAIELGLTDGGGRSVSGLVHTRSSVNVNSDFKGCPHRVTRGRFWG